MRKTASQSEIAKRVPINIVGWSTFGRYPKISPEKTNNMFVSDDWLVPFGGWKRVLNLAAAGTGRGMFVSVRANILILVVGNQVFRIDGDFAPTQIGTLATDVGEVYIDENLNSQICIVDGVNAYIYNWQPALQPNFTIQVVGGGLIPNYVVYHNTFFLFGNGNNTGNGAFWYVYERTTDFTISQVAVGGQQTLQTKPDFAIAVERIPGQSANVLVFGTAVCEIHTQVGGTQNYRRNNTISIDYGCLNPGTIASSDKFVAWLGVNETNAPVIMVYSGSGAQTIPLEGEGDGIDYLMGQIQFPSQSSAMMVRVDGHLFYQLTFYNPVDNITLAYDFNVNKFIHLSDGNLNYHPARDYVYYNGQLFFLSLNNASLYEMSTNITNFDENIVPATDPTFNPALVSDMQRIRITRNYVEPDSSPYIANSLVVTIEQGNDPDVTGSSLANNPDNLITEINNIPPLDQIITEFGDNMVDEDAGGVLGVAAGGIVYQPRVDLSISIDGGINWSNTVSRLLHPLAWRQNVLTWEKMGRANTMSHKFRFWGKDRFVVNDGLMDIY